MNLARLLFRFGRILGKHPLAGIIFCYSERWLPLQRVARTNHLVAFNHPRPSAPIHILIVPTHPLPSLTTDGISLAHKSQIIWEMICLARSISETNDAQRLWQFILNGGNRQDIGQVHGHLQHGWPTLHDTSTSSLRSVDELTAWLEPIVHSYNVHSGDNEGYSLVFTWEGDGSIFAFQT